MYLKEEYLQFCPLSIKHYAGETVVVCQRGQQIVVNLLSYCTCMFVGVFIFPCGMVHRKMVIHPHHTPTYAYSYTLTRTHINRHMDTPFQKESVHCLMNSIPIPDLASAQSKLSSELRNRSSIRTEPLKTPVSAWVLMCVSACVCITDSQVCSVCVCVCVRRQAIGRAGWWACLQCYRLWWAHRGSSNLIELWFVNRVSTVTSACHFCQWSSMHFRWAECHCAKQFL